jgi:NADPH:quinone reductase-like Zn-dependent oxidoreductase
MKALRVHGTAASPSVMLANAPTPQPGPFELLLRVCAAGVTPTELGWYPTAHDRSGAPRLGAIPGHEFSGVVVAVGDQVGGLEVGREVFGLNDWYQDGAMAEYCIAPFSAVAPKPSTITHAEAAAAPISALTSWQGLLDHGRLKPGESVLIHGGAGAVGVYAVQIARLHRAHVVATASAAHIPFLRELGAERVIDYRNERFEDHVQDIDLVFDTVGGDVLRRSQSVLKPGGRMVTIVSEDTPGKPASDAFFIVEPNQKQLSLVAQLLDDNQLRPFVRAVVPLSEAVSAWTSDNRSHAPGKLVVAVN